ncbi:MAG: sulfotransferase domain-containing protein [Deltaproteobacteria bacterium]|nr:sulfotransferase domain-containing protein [Deltaproteobacteria bacterium]
MTCAKGRNVKCTNVLGSDLVPSPYFSGVYAVSTRLTRPTTLAEVRTRQTRMMTKEGMRYALAFQPQPTDVIITPYAKSGTTWVQQIVYGLRTRGDMDFDEITSVIPWIEMAHDLGMDLNQPQKGQPRAFKSHLSWDLVPKGARYIYVIRDPKDVVVSMYHFMAGWWFETGAIPLTTFAREQFLQPKSPMAYWAHVRSWWPHRHDPNVLFLCYEDMQADLSATVERIATFIGCPLDDDLRTIVIHQSSLPFMQANQRHFDDHLIRAKRDAICGLPPGGDSSKVRTGNVGDHARELPREESLEFDRVWREEIEATLGFPSYAAMRTALSDTRR